MRGAGKRESVMIKVPKVRQQEGYDCGAAALCSVALWFGRECSLAECRRLSGCMQDGITIQGVLRGAESLGLEAKALTSPSKELLPLAALESPAIAHITTQEGMLHFVTLCRVTASKVIYMDPAEGEYITSPVERFREEWNGHIIIFKETLPAGRQKFGGSARRAWNSRRKNIKLFARLLRNQVGEICGALAGSAVLVLIGVSNSLFLKHLIDNTLPAGERGMLTFLSFVIFGLIVLGAASGYGRTILVLRNSLKMDYRLIRDYIRKVFTLPPLFFRQYSTGDITSRVEDAFKIRALVSEGLISIFISLLTLALSITLMFTSYRSLALMVLTSIPIYIAIYRFSHRLGKRYNREIAVAGARFETHLLDSLRGAETLKRYGAEGFALGRIEGEYRGMVESLYRSGRSSALLGTLSNSLSSGILATIICAGGFAIFRGELTVGELVAFYTLSSLFTSPLNELIESNSLITAATVSAERLFEIMNLPGEEEASGEVSHREVGTPAGILLEEVTFSHIGRPPLLEGISMRLPPGAITAVIGSNGCGKSTLAQLIMREMEPLSGRIFWGGRDIREIPLQEWRRCISLVPQRPQLFRTTLLENITLGAPADEEALARAVAEAGLAPLVGRLPLGLLTNAGESGALLSGGEMQKIEFARMLYRRPHAVILDEATSSMDNASERMVFETLRRMSRKGVTILVITHKESNLGYADYVVEIDEINMKNRIIGNKTARTVADVRAPERRT